MPKTKLVSLTEKDRNVLKFIWRWKIVSSNALYIKFFSNIKPISAFSRLSKLKRRGLIQPTYIHLNNSHAWSLTRKGFALIKEHLPTLEKQSFKVESPLHDFITAGVHIGNWLNGAPENCYVFSEQQLETYPTEHYPSWVPRCDYYRPDGYWRLPTKTISLEVELHQKTKERYNKVKSFLDLESSVEKCIWIVPNLPMAKRLLKILSSNCNRSSETFQFFLVEDILKRNWNSNVVLGQDQGKTLITLLSTNPSQSPHNPDTSLCSRRVIDTQYCIANSVAYRNS